MTTKVYALSGLLLAPLLCTIALADPASTDHAVNRWRLIHELEYQDENIRPLRREARAAQGAYSSAAQQLMDYVRSYHEVYRLEERKLRDLSNQRQFWQEQVPVLERELMQARQTDDPDRVAALTLERDEAEDRLTDLMGDWVAQQNQLDHRMSELAIEDARLAALRDVREQRAAEANAAAAALSSALRAHPRMQSFESSADRSTD